MLHYKLATKEDLPQAAALLAESFFDYPLYTILKNGFKNPTKYLKVLTKIQEVFLKAHHKNHAILLGVEKEEEDKDGVIATVAVLERADKRTPGLATLLRSGGLGLAFRISPPALFSFLKLLDKAQTACANRKKEIMLQDGSPWFIAVLGVNKQFQGKQMGSCMLADYVMPYAKNEGATHVLLNTNTQANRKFYIKNGFHEFSEEAIPTPKGEIPNWSYVYVCP